MHRIRQQDLPFQGSSHQFVGVGVWDRGSNDVGWDALLGERRRTDAVSIYAAPTRATDLSGLPATLERLVPAG